MRKIAIVFLLFALAFAQEVTENEQEVVLEEVTLEAGISDYIDIIKCLINNEKLVDEVLNVVELVKALDFEKLLPALIQLYADGKEALDQCITPEMILERKKKCVTIFKKKICV